MARITVEDCLEQVDNRFELIMLAAKRARNLAMNGAEPHVPWENDKPTVVALREIAEGYIEKEQRPLTPDELLAMSITATPAAEATSAAEVAAVPTAEVEAAAPAPAEEVSSTEEEVPTAASDIPTNDTDDV